MTQSGVRLASLLLISTALAATPASARFGGGGGGVHGGGFGGFHGGGFCGLSRRRLWRLSRRRFWRRWLSRVLGAALCTELLGAPFRAAHIGAPSIGPAFC